MLTYDQLNRVRYGNQEFYGERPKQRLSPDGNPPGGSYLTKAVEAPSYDGNGNILHLDRWFRSADAAASTAPQQQGANNRLNYGYTPGTNLLATVDGQLASSAPTTDLWQPFDYITGRHGYTYDKSGNLIRETDSAQPTGDIAINWNPYGKVTSVQTADKSTSIDEQYLTTFGYGPDQNRWAKRRLTAAPGSGRDATEATYYVRDAQGATLATYGRSWEYDGTGGGQLEVEPFTLKEQYLFGSTRLGEVAFDRPLVEASEPPTSYGERRYELTNHLGNVTTVFSEHLIDYLDARDAPFTAPELTADRDYLAFGLGLERAESVPLIAPGIPKQSSYRYGFNGKELDDAGEWGSGTTAYDYGFRIYNPAVARFLSVDPLSPDYPWYTPYQFAGNKPIAFSDLDGLEEKDETGVWRDELWGGTYTHVQDDIYIYQRIVRGKSEFYHNAFPNQDGGEWTRIRSRDATFNEYSHLQTGTGAGLSYNGVAGRDQWTEDMKNMFAGMIAVGGGAPLIAAIATEVVAIHTNPLFVINSTAAGFIGDGAVQYIGHAAGPNSDQSFVNNYNIASGAANTFFKNPYLANFVGSYFNISGNSIERAVSTGSFSPLTTNLETGLTGALVGGALGSLGGKITGSTAWSSKLCASFSESTVINSFGETITRKFPNPLRLSLESALEITINSGTLIGTETAKSVTDEQKYP